MCYTETQIVVIKKCTELHVHEHSEVYVSVTCNKTLTTDWTTYDLIWDAGIQCAFISNADKGKEMKKKWNKSAGNELVKIGEKGLYGSLDADRQLLTGYTISSASWAKNRWAKLVRTRSPSNLRQTTRECVCLIRREKFTWKSWQSHRVIRNYYYYYYYAVFNAPCVGRLGDEIAGAEVTWNYAYDGRKSHAALKIHQPLFYRVRVIADWSSTF